MNFSENSHKLFQNTLLKDWGWLIAFLSINIFSGWLIKVSSASVPIVIYFALFPLASIIYSLCKKTWILVLTLVISSSILAFTLCILPLPNVSRITIILYLINILFFAFLLLYVASTRGIVVPALTVILIILLWMIIGWQSMIRLVWYCNLIVTLNKAGRRLRKYLNSFNAAMLVMTGTAAFGLAVGWMLGSL
ncbi:hypothetical protein [Mastigocladopsis repens]|uniref:hypothetical protein n=1 Tax=Mastigocladopsis repens TaxID=221287 RepID=UPI0003150B51|nr:hypothetical protein [Mastigocladopsis repens]